MTIDLFTSAGALWILAALVLGIAELAVPGVFLIFLAVAAGVTGLATLAMPDLPLVAQLGSFAAWSAVAVLAGRRWYGDFPVETTDPLLNDRAARMIGSVVQVATTIEHGSGRVTVGDSTWPVRGPEAAVGTAVRVIAVDGATLVVEPVDQGRSIEASQA